MSRDTRTENYVSHFFSCENSVPPIPIIFSHCSDHDCFRSVSIDTQITYFHIISRQIDFSSDIRRNIMIRTKGYHSPIILIPEHVAVVTKDSITLCAASTKLSSSKSVPTMILDGYKFGFTFFRFIMAASTRKILIFRAINR